MNEKINITNNLEIDKTLKEFEIKSQTEQTQKVPEILGNSGVPKIVQLVMKWAGLKEQKQAEYLLLGFVILAIGVSLYLLFGGRTQVSMNIDSITGKEIIPGQVPGQI